jgi:hypothetical protein
MDKLGQIRNPLLECDVQNAKTATEKNGSRRIAVTKGITPNVSTSTVRHNNNKSPIKEHIGTMGAQSTYSACVKTW